MSIKRAPRPESNFYILDKAISENKQLSFAGRGLLVFLLGKPDHWVVSVQNLINETAKAVGKKSGREHVYALLRELETVGYLSRERVRADGGEFGHTDYVVSEHPVPASPMPPDPNKPNSADQEEGDAPDRASAPSPDTENPYVVTPHTDSPYTGKPYTGKPDTANPTLVSIEGLVRTEDSARTDLKVAPGVETPARTGEVVSESSSQSEPHPADQPRVAIPDDMPGPKDTNAKTYRAWANYAITYRKRYHAWPIWNAKVAGQMGQLVERLGADMAPKVAAYYLRIGSDYYIRRFHSVGTLLADCEGIATQMATGTQMTSTKARQMDGAQAQLSSLDEAKRLMRERRNA